LKTLDGTERALPPDTCMIADGDGSRLVGVGGIMAAGRRDFVFDEECADRVRLV